MTWAEYQAYLASPEWAKRRRRIRRRARGRCERCHWLRIQDVHHLTYERLGHEDPSDLLGVCRPCHEFLHGRSSHDPRPIGLWMRRIKIALWILMLCITLLVLWGL
jgi:hypothetical protein